jgi:hypothetical protein
MTEEKRRTDKLYDALTRDRKPPKIVRRLGLDHLDFLDYLGSEQHKRDSNAAFRMGVFGLAYGAVLFGIGWIVFTVFHLK